MTLTSKDITFTPGNHRYHITDTKPKVYIPSVTTITGILDKPFLVQWAANCASEATFEALITHEGKLDEEQREAIIGVGKKAHRDKREEGANVGTAVHNHVKSVLVPGWKPEEGDEVDGGIEAEMAIMAFDQWYAEHVEEEGAVPLLVEQMVVHPSGKYVGTFDLLVRKANGKLRLIDWKTSNASESNPCALYPEYIFQTAAYCRAVEDTPEFRAEGIIERGEFIEDAQVVSLGKNGQLTCTTMNSVQIDTYADAFMSLAEILPVYRQVERDIRAFNKAEKQRREALMQEA